MNLVENAVEESVKTMDYMLDLTTRYPGLSVCAPAIRSAFDLLTTCFRNGGKLLTAGNGGSAADSDHIVGELMKGFVKKRAIGQDLRAALGAVAPEYTDYIAGSLQGALPAIALPVHSALVSAYANDAAPDLVYAQEVLGYGRPGDVFLGISTSGNSKNILYAAITAKAKKMKTILLTGKNPCAIEKYADVAVHAPADKTYKIQEYHLPIYHTLCLMLEEEFFS
jgi:D-sedoheptulose 7-phosphate isomerase